MTAMLALGQLKIFRAGQSQDNEVIVIRLWVGIQSLVLTKDRMQEVTKNTVTVEFPISNEMAELSTQYMFEVIRQQIASIMDISPDEVWVKSVSAITNYDIGDEVTGHA
jgi:hypothetical protein